MSLLITITKAPDSVSPAESSKTFGLQGGTLGRGKDNSWTLDDPERFLSSKHCEFSNENGQYYITDTSTNGTFYNGSPNPIGKGSKLPLNDGDSFLLGDYEFSVSILGGGQASAPSDDPFGSPASASPFSADDPFASAESGFGADSDFSDSPFGGGGGIASGSESLFSTSPEETDPLAALDKAQGGSSNIDSMGGLPDSGGFAGTSDPFESSPSADPFAGPTHSDQADPLNQQVSWPSAVPEQSDFNSGGIPDDWDDDLMAGSTPAPPPAPQVSPQTAPPQPAPPVAPAPTPAPAPAPPVAPTAPPVQQAPPVVPKPAQAPIAPSPVAAQPVVDNANAKIQAELELLKKQISAQQGSAAPANVTVDTALIAAMGLQNQNLGDAEIAQINQLTGEVVREMVSGLMQVLGSRSSIKNEFRMNVTTIQPVENNPLKFSANVDDALENMFIKQGNAYKKPVDAVREGFEGIAEHQVAILAGIKAAFKGVIERFDPALLEARFAKQNKGGIQIPGMQKARNWELYMDYYNDLAGDIDSSFQYLFGDDFVQAYEDQLQKLTIARKSDKQTK